MVTRSSLVWVMTGIAAGIAGGWLWNRGRVDDPPVIERVSSSETLRSPFTPRREERPTYRASTDVERSGRSPSNSTRLSAAFSERRALYDSASGADREELASMIAAARSLANPVERRTRLEVLLLRYAELDLDGALGMALENDRETAAHLLAALAATAPERAWASAKDVTNAAERFAYLNAVAGAWAAQDPERAFAEVTQLPAQWQRTELLRLAVLEIASRDPRLAIRLAESQGSIVSGQLIELIATQWSRDNPSEAARWVESLSRPDQARYAYRVANAYVSHKPTEALAWALRLAGSPQRYLWSSMLGEMAKYDPDQALQIAQSADGPAQRAQAMGKVLASIAQTDPSMAMSHLLKLPAGRMRSEVLGEVARSVATLSPTAALDWVNDIDNEAMQLEAAQSLGWALSRRNVDAAAQLIDRVPKEARANWIMAVASAYAEFDIDKGRQWVSRYSGESQDVSAQFARIVATRNPELAMELIGDVSDDRERDRLLRGVLQPLAEHSPAAAARLVEKISDEDARARSSGEVAGVWAQYDLPASRKWALSLSDGPAKDQALTALVQRGAGSLDDMVPIINEIRTPERRQHAVLMAAMQLSRRDLDSARTLLRRYPLDPARQRQFDQYVQRRDRGP